MTFSDGRKFLTIALHYLLHSLLVVGDQSSDGLDDGSIGEKIISHQIGGVDKRRMERVRGKSGLIVELWGILGHLVLFLA